MRRRFLIFRQPHLLCEQTRRFICIAWVGWALVVCVGVGGLLKSHKEREECRMSWNDFAADTKTGADPPSQLPC